MRLFQNSGLYRAYRPRLAELTKNAKTFREARAIFIEDRFGSAHILKPAIDGDPDSFFTNGDDLHLQGLWAQEQGMPTETSLEDVLLAQIEEHRSEVFYNSDPMRYGDGFLEKLPGSVKRTIAWRAAPSGGGRFLRHDVIVNNFPSLLEGYRSQGARAEYFFPAHDPELNSYANNQRRPIDVLFVGTYSRYHQRRAAVLESIATLRDRCVVTFHLDQSRLTKLAESPLGLVWPLAGHRRSKEIRRVSSPPVFGRELLSAIGNSKIVINGAIDMAGVDRGNMRVWEALGCGAALVTDEGHYPEGMIPSNHFATYRSPGEAMERVLDLLDNDAKRASLAECGHSMIATSFSKSRQWSRFLEIVQ